MDVFRDFMNELVWDCLSRLNFLFSSGKVDLILQLASNLKRLKKEEGRLLLEVEIWFHLPKVVPFVMIFQRRAFISHQNTDVYKLLWSTATCFGVNNCTSPEHGSCKTTDVCQCNPGYIGQLHGSSCGCLLLMLLQTQARLLLKKDQW